MSPKPDERARSDALLLWLAFCLPVAVALWRASSGVQWRGDLPSLRDQGLVAIELGGAASMVITQAALLLPLGSHAFRAAFASAIALGFVGLLIHRITRRFIADTDLPPWLRGVLSCSAAIMATLSPSFQREATVGGGGVMAAALALWAMDRVMPLTARDGVTLTPAASRAWLLVAAVLGLVCAENIPVGVAAMLAVLLTVMSGRRRPTLRLLPALLAVLVATFAIASAGVLLRPLSPGSWSDVARALSVASLDALETTATRRAALLAWLDELGVVSLMLGALGLGSCLFREHRRPWSGLMVAPLVVDVVVPLSVVAGASSDPLASLRLLALGVFAVAAAVGVAEVVCYLRALRVPMARTASVLMVVFHMTLVAVTSEDAAFSADRSEHLAAEEWTDEALGAVPRDAALVVHSPELTWRLWAAQSLGGMRPDVVVVPAPMLRHGRVTANLLPSEPAVAHVLRDFALTGVASEYGLSMLADARPLLVELDPRWDARVVSHLSVEGPWLRYAPQVLGPSDRPAQLRHVLAADGRIGRALEHARARDTTSETLIAKTLKEHTTALSLVGLGPTTKPLLDGVELLVAEDAFVTSARLRLAYAQQVRSRRPIDMRDLLAFDTQ
jgi:hypothetical protein